MEAPPPPPTIKLKGSDEMRIASDDPVVSRIKRAIAAFVEPEDRGLASPLVANWSATLGAAVCALAGEMLPNINTVTASDRAINLLLIIFYLLIDNNP